MEKVWTGRRGLSCGKANTGENNHQNTKNKHVTLHKNESPWNEVDTGIQELGFKSFDYRDCRFYTMHLFFAIPKIGIGHVLGEPLF
jgi:hypothetical protein